MRSIVEKELGRSVQSRRVSKTVVWLSGVIVRALHLVSRVMYSLLKFTFWLQWMPA